MGQIRIESGAANTAEHRKSQAIEKEAEDSDDAEQGRMA